MKRVTATFVVDSDLLEDENPVDTARAVLRDLLDQGFEPTQVTVEEEGAVTCPVCNAERMVLWLREVAYTSVHLESYDPEAGTFKRSYDVAGTGDVISSDAVSIQCTSCFYEVNVDELEELDD